MKKIISSLLIVGSMAAYSNNIQIGVPSIPSTTTIQFTIQWDNSWNTSASPNNWDGVWVFVKMQNCTNNLWEHVQMSTVSANHTVTGGVLQVDAVTDGMGVFIRRITTGFGNIASATVTLKFNTLVDAGYNYQVFGIEVVNVPSGDFYIGDGTRGTNGWGFSAAPANTPLLITNAIQSAGLGAASNYQVNSYGSTGALPSTFPLGWNSYYCMKYEISQEQYAAFLNTLTYDQQTGTTASAPSSAAGTLALAPAINSRNGIRIQTSGTLNNIPAIYGNDLNGNGIFGEAADGQNLACNWLQWTDVTAYLAWAALRPMTEFEFEKSCRGTNAVTANEDAWGMSTVLQALSSALVNPGATNEVSTASGTGLCAYGASTTADGPLRCGFAATAATIRTQSGGSFYGIMELSGNVMEQCIGGYACNYSAFTTVCGNGTLSSGGAATTVGWPSPGGGQGVALGRGGDWYTNTAAYLNVSDRHWMTDNTNQARDYRFGGRGVR